MKKTLALILALLMILSVALVSCGDKKKETEESTEDPWNYGGDEPGNNEGEDGSDNNGNSTISGTYEPAAGKIYVCYKAVLRETDKITSDEIATVEFGTALDRTEKNKKWSKVTYNGTTAYIANDLISESQSAVTFNDVEANTTRKVSNLGDAKNANLRLYPLALTNPSVVDMETFNASSIIGQIPKDTVVTVLKVSEDKKWAYIECDAMKAKGDGKYETTATKLSGYCIISAFDSGFGSTNSSNSNGGALG